MINPRSRAVGCIFGLAVGDALGAPVEFLSRSDIIAKFGLAGIIDFEPWGGFRAGSWTDDTQMSIATAEGLIAARAAGRVDDPISFIHREYLAWLGTQDDPFHQRAPGRACLTALRSGVCGTVDRPINGSKGCGGVMRTAVVGLVYEDPDQAFEVGVQAAAVTHGHPSGYLPAGFLASLISEMMNGVTLADAMNWTARRLQQWRGHEECLGAIINAMQLVGTDYPADQCIAAIGQGWVGEEALAIALFCSLRFSTYRDAVLAAVNHGGDSDSTGSIAGAIMGTLVGFEMIPATWVERVEGSAMLGRVATALVDYDRLRTTVSGYRETTTR